MPSASHLQFLSVAARMRKALSSSKPQSVAEPEPKTGVEPDRTEPDSSQQGQETRTKAKPDYLFDETGIRVSSTTIEFGKFTYVLKHLASTKRIDKVPSRVHYQMGIALTLFALFIMIIYIFTGHVTFGWGAVIYLTAGMLAFVISLFAYRSLKSTHILVFKDAGGTVIQSVKRHDKSVIDRLEKAVKLAISQNRH